MGGGPKDKQVDHEEWLEQLPAEQRAWAEPHIRRMSRLNTEQRNLVEALSKEDPLGKVIRAQIVIERLVHELLDMAAETPEPLKEARLNYNQLVRVVVALGLVDKGLLHALLSLGNLRNDMAHGEIETLEQSRVHGFVGSFSSEHVAGIKELFRGLPKPQKRGGDFKSLIPENRFSITAAYLSGALVAALFERAKADIEERFAEFQATTDSARS